MSSRLKLGSADYFNKKIVIVLGGGILPDGSLPLHVIKRLEKAVEVGGEHSVFICSSIFTLNKPQIVIDGWVRSEANEMASYLKKLDPRSIVLMENASFDTVGSAIFTRIIFDFLLKNKDVVVVSSDFHIRRVTTVFKKVLELQESLDLESIEFVCSVSHLNSKDRTKHENKATKDFILSSSAWTSIDDAKLWLLTEHDNYRNFISNSNFSPEKLAKMGY